MIKFQYNKTSLQGLEKDLKMRVRTLPTLKSKESALRMEVKKCKDEALALDLKIEEQIATYQSMHALWNEFDASLVSIADVHLRSRKIAGVPVPVLDDIDLAIAPFSMFDAPAWLADGVRVLREMAHTGLQRDVVGRQLDLLEFARKKTTQKVNLFEKVQIPGYQDAIRKIKRFMEDEESLSKASQKIMRAAQERHTAHDGSTDASGLEANTDGEFFLREIDINPIPTHGPEDVLS
jgi:V/A-type H+-transporting ATPase subunit D